MLILGGIGEEGVPRTAALTGGSLFLLLWLNPHLGVASLCAQPAGLSGPRREGGTKTLEGSAALRY